MRPLKANARVRDKSRLFCCILASGEVPVHMLQLRSGICSHSVAAFGRVRAFRKLQLKSFVHAPQGNPVIREFTVAPLCM